MTPTSRRSYSRDGGAGIRQISHYQVLERIGSGGMGTVWLAEDLNLGRRVVLKFLSEELGRNQQALERFKQEARTASSLNHPNICTIYEVGEAEGEYFIAMEYIEGEGLDRYLLRHRLDVQEILDLALQIVDALDAAHSGGIVHRDIKPANILITPRGKAKVLDFGLAKLMTERRMADQPTYAGATLASDEHLTSPGMTVGTTAFMSPEQARGQELDARSDLFSFGAVLYEMSTGKLPFDGTTAAVIFDGILNRDPEPPIELNPELPPKLDEIIRTALEKDRDLRYQSAAEMRAELRRLKRDTSSGRVPLQRSSTIAQLKLEKTRNFKYVFIALGLAVLGGLGLIGYRFFAGGSHGFNLQKMKITQVTTSGNAVASALSPDRRYIVYALRDGALESLWVQQLATGSNIQVLPPDQAHFVAVSFTPDGNYIMFVRSDKSTANFRYLYRMPVLGGSPQQLVRDVDSAPSFSPDGRSIAYVRGILQPTSHDFLVANADGTGERVLARRLGFIAGLAKISWSPDGKFVAVTSPETRDNKARFVLEIIALNNGEVRDLHSFPVDAQALAWLPNSSGLLALAADPQSGRGQIWFVKYPSGEISRFTNDLANYDLCCLDITGDGDSLVALQNTVLSDIWVAKADAAEPQQITSGEPLGLNLQWTGDRIVALDAQFHWLALSPDGRSRSAMAGGREPRINLSACNDGKHIVYTTFRDGNLELWRSDADGSNAIQLSANGTGSAGTCTPDSKAVTYVNSEGIWRVPIEGGNPEKLPAALSAPSSPRAVRGSLNAYSPDGTLFVHVEEEFGNGAPRSQIVVTQPDGNVLYKFNAPYGMRSTRFTPDSKALAFLLTRQGATNIWKQPLTGGDPVQLTKFTRGEIFDFAWSVDGKHLAFSRGERKTDVVMMTDFR